MTKAEKLKLFSYHKLRGLNLDFITRYNQGTEDEREFYRGMYSGICEIIERLGLQDELHEYYEQTKQAKSTKVR